MIHSCAFQCNWIIAKCSVDNCQVQLCRVHGDGRGRWDPTKDVEQVWLPKRFCMSNECGIAYCEKHKEQMLECSACLKQAAYAENVVGDNWFPAEFPLCKTHAQHCQRSVCASGDDEGASVEQPCGLTCCADCITNHVCLGEFDDRDEY